MLEIVCLYKRFVGKDVPIGSVGSVGRRHSFAGNGVSVRKKYEKIYIGTQYHTVLGEQYCPVPVRQKENEE